MLLIYAFSVALFYILARFRLPALPLAAMAGGIYLGQLIRKQEKGVFFRNLLYLGCGVFFVFLLYPLYLLTYEPFVMEYCRPCGVRNKVLPEDVPGMGEGGKRPWEMLLDSSSPLQGSYRALPLKEGHIFIKKFLVSPGNPLPEKERGTLIIPFSASLPSSFLLEHDGGKEFVEISPPLKYVRINHIPLTSRSLPDGKESIGVKFRVSSISGDPAIFLDAARDYGRSLIGSDAASTPEAAGMEIVLRLLLPHQEK
jgi:hypothetical protein